MLCGRGGPTRECLPAFFGARRVAAIVQRICVIKDEESANLVWLERGHQAIVRREIIFAGRRLRKVPYEIHAHPTKAGVRNHLHLARTWIGEVNVDPQAISDGNIADGWRRGTFTAGAAGSG